MTAPTCDCGGRLLKVMRWRADRLGLEAWGGPVSLSQPAGVDEHHVYKCSTCGAISSKADEDNGQGDLLEEVT